ncbi:MAG: TniQ family protein [Porphyrobacter sp.]|nr:TniQ family protein [Porphyrobacter sp.]
MNQAATNLVHLRPLPLVVESIIGESATSFISRLSEKNGVALWQVRKVVSGHIRLPIDKWSDLYWERLASLSRQLLLDFEPMRHRRANLATCSTAKMFLGHPIMSPYLLRGRFRLCPTCLSERHMLREVWSLFHVVACSRHGCELIEKCECGRKFDESKRGDSPFTCICGKPFRDYATAAASVEAVEGTRWIEQRLSSWVTPLEEHLMRKITVPEPLRTMPVNDMLAFINVVGRVASTPPEQDEIRSSDGVHRDYPHGDMRGIESLAACTGVVEAAVRILKDWPAAFRALLEEVSARNASSSPTTRSQLFRTRMGRLLVAPPNGLDRQPLPGLFTQLSRFCEEQGVVLQRKRPIRHSSTARRIAKTANVAQLAKELGVCAERKLFLPLYNKVAVGLDNLTADTAEIETIFRDEMVRRWQEIEAQMPACDVARYLDGASSTRSVHGWIEADFLHPETDPTDHGRKTRKKYNAEEVRQLRRKLAEISRKVDTLPPGYELYETVSKAVTTKYYHRSDLLRDVFQGTFETLTLVAEPRLTDLHLNQAIVRGFGLARRVAQLINTDAFGLPFFLGHLLDELWPQSLERLDPTVRKKLRRHRLVRFTDVRNTTEGRDRPLYKYSFVDMLERQLLLNGPSTSTAADELILSKRNSASPLERESCARDSIKN